MVDTATNEVVHTIRVSSGTGCAIKSLVFSHKGDVFIVNSMDKVLRLYKYVDAECGLGSFFLSICLFSWFFFFLFLVHIKSF